MGVVYKKRITKINKIIDIMFRNIDHPLKYELKDLFINNYNKNDIDNIYSLVGSTNNYCKIMSYIYYGAVGKISDNRYHCNIIANMTDKVSNCNLIKELIERSS